MEGGGVSGKAGVDPIQPPDVIIAGLVPAILLVPPRGCPGLMFSPGMMSEWGVRRTHPKGAVTPAFAGMTDLGVRE